MVKIDQYDVLHNIDPHGRNKYWLFWHKCCSSWASMNDTMSFWFFWIVSIRHMFSCSEKHGPEQHDLIRHECKASTTSIWDIKITLVILTVRFVWKMWLGTMYCSCGETQGDFGNCILPSTSVTPIRVNIYVV